jgi:ABC-type spermidine/putrescine transport system permease subunit I
MWQFSNREAFTVAAFLSVFVNVVSERFLSRLRRSVSEDFTKRYGGPDQVVPMNELRSMGKNEAAYVTWDSFRMAAVVVSAATSIGSIICFILSDVPSGEQPIVIGAVLVGCVGVVVVGYIAMQFLIPMRWVRELFI